MVPRHNHKRATLHDIGRSVLLGLLGGVTAHGCGFRHLRAQVLVRAMFVVLPLAVVAGCTIGPDFKPPPAPLVTHYGLHPANSTVATPGVAGGGAQQFDFGANTPADWWTRFGSSSLDALVRMALKNNHELKAARAALTAAHESVLAQRGTFFPSLSAGFSASRQRTPQTLAPVPNDNALLFSLLTPQLTIGYAPDLFGLNRRTAESLQAEEAAVRFQAVAAWNTLTTNVVATAVQVASLREQIRVTERLIALEKKSLAILQDRFNHGDASKLDVTAQRTQIAQTEAGLPPLNGQLIAMRNALAVLVGAFPSDGPAANLTLATFHLPQALPLSLPSRLVAQRPDVRQARATLHAASAAIGIATAERLPEVELTADVGSTALGISKIFGSGTGFWGLAASLTDPFFEGGALIHQERAAKADYVVAAQQYRQTVLTAFENVADTLAVLQQDAKALQVADAASRAAKTTLELSQVQLRHGYIGAFQLIAAQQAYQQAKVTLVQAQASRFVDTAALFQALGGGWWNDSKIGKAS